MQAPATMKSILQAGWLLTVASGNIVVMIVAYLGGSALSQVSDNYSFVSGFSAI